MSLLNLFRLNLSKVQKERIIRNFNSESYLNITVIISQIFFPPLMIMIYGLEKFGIWIFITAIPTSLAILNFNINGAAKTEMSIYFNKNKKKKVSQIFTCSVFSTLCVLFLLIVSSSLLFFFSDFKLNILKSLNYNELNIIFFCVFASFHLDLLNGIFKTGLIYKGDLHEDNNISIFCDVFTKLLIIVFGLISTNLTFAAIGFMVGSINKLFIYYYYYLNYNKQNPLFLINYFSIKQIIKLFKLSTSYYFESLHNLFKNSFQIIILGIFFNAQILGMINTFKTMFYFFPSRILNMINRVATYEFTKMYSKKKIGQLNKFFVNYIKIILISVCTYVIFSIILGELIYNFWLSNSYIFDYKLLLLIIFDISFIILSYNISIINRSTNNFFRISTMSLVINVIIFLATYILFLNNFDYQILFLLNLIGSILLFIFCINEVKKLQKKFI